MAIYHCQLTYQSHFIIRQKDLQVLYRGFHLAYTLELIQRYSFLLYFPLIKAVTFITLFAFPHKVMLHVIRICIRLTCFTPNSLCHFTWFNDRLDPVSNKAQTVKGLPFDFYKRS